MTDHPVKPSRHHLWRISKRALSKSWDDSIFSGVRPSGVLVGVVSAAAAAGDAGQSGLRGAAVRPGHHGRDRALPGVDVEQDFLAQRRPRDHRADHRRHRSRRSRRSGVVGLLDFAVGGVVGDLCLRRLGGRGARPDAAAASGAPAPLRAGAVCGHAALRHRHCAADGARAAQARRVHSRRPAGRAGLRLLPRAARRPDRHRGRAVPRRLAGPDSVPPADLRRDPGQCRVCDRDPGAAHLPEIHHRHRLHLRGAGDADRVPAVRLLRRLLDHAGRRVQRRHPRRMAGPADACPPDATVAGQARQGSGRGRPRGTDDDEPSPADSDRVSSS